jgi:uncharacterized membrane protein
MKVGRFVFAAVLIAVGLMGFIKREYMPIWPPAPEDKQFLLSICAGVSLACGIGLAWDRTAKLAARGFLAYLALWAIVFPLRELVEAPGEFGNWYGWAEPAVIAGAACIFATGERGKRVARILYGVALLPLGLGHFIYAKQTIEMTPSWIPAHSFWAYFFGATFIAAGIGIVFGVLAKWAAALSTLQVGIFTAFVWIPVIAKGTTEPFFWTELGLSIAMTAAGWVITESYQRATS